MASVRINGRDGFGRGGSNASLDNIERALVSLQRLNHASGSGGGGNAQRLQHPGRRHEGFGEGGEAARINALHGTAALGDLQSNLQDLCTTLCISGEAHLRTLDVAMHVELLLRCFRAAGVGHDVQVLSLRAVGLLAEGSPRGVSAIVACDGVTDLLAMLEGDLSALIASDQLTEEVLKVLKAVASESHRSMLRANALPLLLRLAAALSDAITKHLAYSCVDVLLSVATPEDWGCLEGPLGELLQSLDDRVRALKGAMADRNRMRRPETKQQAAQLRGILANIRRDEALIVRLASCFVHLIDRVCVGDAMCDTVFSSACGERIVPLALTLLSFAESSEPSGAAGGRGGAGDRGGGGGAGGAGAGAGVFFNGGGRGSQHSSATSAARLRSAAISLISTMFVASPSGTLERLSRHGAWRSLRSLTVALVSSSSGGNTMRAMVYGNVTDDQLELLADLNAGPPPADAGPVPSAAAAAAVGNGANAQAIAAANRSLIAMIRTPTEPLVTEEFSAIGLAELLLLLTPVATSVVGGGSSEHSLDSRSALTPIHAWQWEDEFHNRYDYEEHVSTALELEYKTQQVTQLYRSVDITAAGRSVSASFETMRHYTLGGVPLRPLFRQPFVSHFYHTKAPLFVACSCYQPGVKESASPFFRPPHQNQPQHHLAQRAGAGAERVGGGAQRRRSSGGHTLSHTRGERGENQTPPRRGAQNNDGGDGHSRRRRGRSGGNSKSKNGGGGFFSRLFSSCCSSAGRDTSPGRRGSPPAGGGRRAGDSPRGTSHEGTDSIGLEEVRGDHFFDNACRTYLEANPPDAVIIGSSLVGLATVVVRRVVNPALLRHCAVLLLRGLTLLRDVRHARAAGSVVVLATAAGTATPTEGLDDSVAVGGGGVASPPHGFSPKSPHHSASANATAASNPAPAAAGNASPPASPNSSLAAHDYVVANRAAIVRAIHVLLLCSDLDRPDRLAATAQGPAENADHTHAPRWQMASGAYGERPLGFAFSLQGEMLLAALESVHLLVELYPPAGEELAREGVYRLVSGGAKSLATVCDPLSCPQHQPAHYLLAEAHRRLGHAAKVMEAAGSPVALRHSSSSALFGLIAGRQSPAATGRLTPRNSLAGGGGCGHSSRSSMDSSLLGGPLPLPMNTANNNGSPTTAAAGATTAATAGGQCPIALHHALSVLQALKRGGGAISVGDQLAACFAGGESGSHGPHATNANGSGFCLLCAAAAELLRGDMTTVSEANEQQSTSAASSSTAVGGMGGRRLTNRHGQTLRELLSAPAGAHYRAALEELAVRLVTYVSDLVGVAGSSTADVVSVTRNHKTVTQPTSRTMSCVQQRLSLPIGFKLTPAHPQPGGSNPSSSSAAAEEGPSAGGGSGSDSASHQRHFVTVRGRPRECVPSHGGIVSINLQAFLFTTVGAVADDLAAKYSEVMVSLGWGCSCDEAAVAAGGEVCAHCQQLSSPPLPQPPAAAVPTNGQQLRSPQDEAVGGGHVTPRRQVGRRLSFQRSPDVLPNQIIDDDESAHDARTADSGVVPTRRISHSGGPLSSAAPPPQAALVNPHPPIPSERVLLLVNGYPLLDRTRRLGDVIVSFGNSAAAFRAMHDPTGTDQEAKAALARALSVWGSQHTIQFAFLKDPLPPSSLPAVGPAGCTCGVGFGGNNDDEFEGSARNSSDADGGGGDSTLHTADMRVAIARYRDCLCSPWHIYSDQRRRHGHALIDDLLSLIAALVEAVVAPLSPSLLLDACRKMYSAVTHSIRHQSLSFAAPVFSALCHPILSSHQVGDSVAEYALWNYPSLFPLALRLAVFRQIIAAKRSIMPKGNMAARNVVGGEWLGLLSPGGAGGGGNNNNATAAAATTRNGKIKAIVRRDNILAEGRRVFEALAMCPLTLDVTFDGEPGSGLGPTCEFFCLVAQELLKRRHSMWQALEPADAEADDEAALSDDTGSLFDGKGAASSSSSPSSPSKRSPFMSGRLFPAYRQSAASLALFTLLGRLIGRALQDGREVRVPLHTLFIRRILGQSAEGDGDALRRASFYGGASQRGGGPSSFYRDRVALSEALAGLDPQLEASLAKIEELPPETVDSLEMTFTFPGLDDLALVPNGGDTLVTGANVEEYCAAVRRYACVEALEAPTRCVLEGIAESVVPGHLRLFAPNELSLLIGGQEGKLWTTAEDLVRSVQCDHGYTMQSPAVMFFVSTVVAFSADEQRQFLQFIAGTDCLPIGGLYPPITIVRKGLTADATPFRRRRRQANGLSPHAVSPSVGPSEAHGGSPAPLLLAPVAVLPPRTPQDAFLSVGNDGIPATSEGSFTAAIEQSAAAGPLEIPEADPHLLTPNGDRAISEGSPSYSANPMADEAVVLTTQEQVDECLPTVNTCFHYLKLPDYSSEAVCRERLLCAITEGQGVFLLS